MQSSGVKTGGSDIRDAFIDYKKIHELDKVFCKICIYGVDEIQMDTFRYHIYDSTGKVLSGTFMNTQGHVCEFVFDRNPTAKHYFVKVDFSIKGMTRQFTTFEFITEKNLDERCTCETEGETDNEEDNEPKDSEKKSIKSEVLDYFGGIIDRESRRKMPPQPPLEDEEFDMEIQKKKRNPTK